MGFITVRQQPGVEVCRRLRAMPQTVDTPVLMLTAKVPGEAALRAGADDYMVKSQAGQHPVQHHHIWRGSARICSAS